MAFDLAQEKVAAGNSIKRIPIASARDRLRAELENLISQHALAASPQKEEIEARIMQLRRDAEIASGVSLWSWASIGLVSGVTLLYFASIFFFLRGLGPERYASVEAVRPIIVFTLIVAMLGFGGLLIVRALFSEEGDEEFQKRFRHAREIFLVFAGIFGTIIGFYFGASDEEGGNAPSVEVAATADLTITATVEGGFEPFIAMLTLADGGGTPLSGEGRTLSARLEASQCPLDATVIVVDGRGRRAEAEVEQGASELNRLGWECPEEEAREPADTTNENGGNTTNEAAQNSA